MHWRGLEKERIIEAYTEYLEREWIDGNYSACLYVLSCASGRARLSLVKDLEAWDIDETRQLIWRRRFENFCPGETANIGIQVIPADATTNLLLIYSETAVWSFYGDRFIPRLSRFHSAAFSEEPWERCTPAVAFLRPDGLRNQND